MQIVQSENRINRQIKGIVLYVTVKREKKKSTTYGNKTTTTPTTKSNGKYNIKTELLH